jgi:hypothetical protein
LPELGFVFCSFNNNWKITPEVCDVWMRLLHEVEGSTLWLLRDNEGAERNLGKEAQQRGIEPSRLVFAGRMQSADHLARHRLADLFLDTLPCNAHTTASDALWAGLPVLTCLGEAFPGRVAASLLHGAGMADLVTTDLEQETPQPVQQAGAIVERLGEIRPQRQRPIVAGQCLLVAPEIFQHIAPVEERFDVVRTERQRTVVALERFVEAIELDENVALVGDRSATRPFLCRSSACASVCGTLSGAVVGSDDGSISARNPSAG